MANEVQGATAGRRLKVLISAYACGPGDEPEGAAGWAFATAAAQHHDVWVLTRKRFEPVVSAALADDPDLARHLQVAYLDLPLPILRLKRGPGSLYWYYSMWQITLRAEARRIHASIGFDVLHHVTFANDWLPCGLVGVEGVPFIWGPVGGASRPPWRLARWLGIRGLVTEVVRTAFVWPIRRIFGDAASRRASVVVAQNADVADRFRSASQVVIEANAAMPTAASSLNEGMTHRVAPNAVVRDTDQDLVRPTSRYTAVMVGRLIGLKGCRLALAALARAPVSEWRLEVFGDGYDRSALERRATSLNLSSRIRFHGHRPRQEVLRAIADADALLFPSFRDQAGWVAAEASSFGTPVVCLPLGGPALLAGSNARVSSVHGDVAGNLADTLAACAGSRGRPDARWSIERLPSLIDSWYLSAVERGTP